MARPQPPTDLAHSPARGHARRRAGALRRPRRARDPAGRAGRLAARRATSTTAGAALDDLLARATSTTATGRARHRRHAAGGGLRLGAGGARGRHAAVRPAHPGDGARTRSRSSLPPATRRSPAWRSPAARTASRATSARAIRRSCCWRTRTRCSQRLHDELEAHLEPLLEAISAATGRPLRALWRSAGDRLGGAFLWLGEVVGVRERAWELGTRCMQAGGPLAVGAGFRVLEHAGIAEPTRNRRSCCLIWRAEGQDTCFTCPLTSEAERCARLEARAAAAA